MILLTGTLPGFLKEIVKQRLTPLKATMRTIATPSVVLAVVNMGHKVLVGLLKQTAENYLMDPLTVVKQQQ